MVTHLRALPNHPTELVLLKLIAQKLLKAQSIKSADGSKQLTAFQTGLQVLERASKELLNLPCQLMALEGNQRSPVDVFALCSLWDFLIIGWNKPQVSYW
jgi:hypothetical protein